MPKSTPKLLLLLLPITLLGCGATKPVCQPTNVQQQEMKRSEKLSHITQENSTVLLQKADSWLANSGQLLNSVNDKFSD